MVPRDGFLKAHADFNLHSRLALFRRVNVFLYLNERWDPRWGGELALFDAGADSELVAGGGK